MYDAVFSEIKLKYKPFLTFLQTNNRWFDLRKVVLSQGLRVYCAFARWNQELSDEKGDLVLFSIGNDISSMFGCCRSKTVAKSTGKHNQGIKAYFKAYNLGERV